LLSLERRIGKLETAMGVKDRALVELHFLDGCTTAEQCRCLPCGRLEHPETSHSLVAGASHRQGLIREYVGWPCRSL
jgi:hypothetical protein